MSLDDYAYYRRRVVQEDEAARGAASAVANKRHRQLADAYRARCTFLLATIAPAPAPRGGDA